MDPSDNLDITLTSGRDSAAPTPRSASVAVHYLQGRIDGIRIVDSRLSPLRVYAGPWPHLLTQLPQGLPPAPGTYLLCRPSISGPPRIIVRPGEANDIRRRLQEHALDASKASFQEAFAVCSVDDRLTKSDTRFMEARLHEIILASPTSSLEVDRVPALQSASGHGQDDLETLLDQARLMLSAAGCIAVDAPHLPAAPAEQRDEGVVAISEGASSANEDEHELTYDSIWARGYPTNNGWIVRAGSDVRRRENAALLPPVANRRRMLLERGILGSMPGVDDRWRLLADVFCSSSLLAAKLVCGAHVTHRGIWHRLLPSERMIIAK